MMNHKRILTLLFLLLLLVNTFCACKALNSTSVLPPPSLETPEALPDLPPAALPKVRQLIMEAKGTPYAPLLCEEVSQVLTLGNNLFVILSKWQDRAVMGGSDFLYLPILVYAEDLDWNAMFLGENALLLSSLKYLEPGAIHTISLQASPISDGVLFLARGSYVRSALGSDELNDNIGTKQQTIDLKEIDPSGCATWLFAAQAPTQAGSVYFLSDGGAANEKDDLIFLYVETLTEDYRLTCGELKRTGSELLQNLYQSSISQSGDGSLIEN